MDLPPADHWVMLKEARARVHRLVESLSNQQNQFEGGSTRMPSASRIEGRKAFVLAVASARRAVAAIDEAAVLAAVRQSGTI